MTEKHVHIYISGFVQGVFFRANSVRNAKLLGVTGWVKNLPDGRVEIMAEGNERIIDQMIEWCKKGPRGAKVENIHIENLPYNGEFNDFIIHY